MAVVVIAGQDNAPSKGCMNNRLFVSNKTPLTRVEGGRAKHRFRDASRNLRPALILVTLPRDSYCFFRCVNEKFSQFLKRAMSVLSFVDVTIFYFLWRDKKMSRK